MRKRINHATISLFFVLATNSWAWCGLVTSTVTFKTGVDTTPVDGLDDNFKMIVSSGSGVTIYPSGSDPTSAQFLSVRTSLQNAYILPQPPLLQPNHPDPTVAYIGSTPTAHGATGDHPSMLTAFEFTVPNLPIQTATLEFFFYSDDGTRIYINELFVDEPFPGRTNTIDVTS